jgi:hypothetical protein
MNLQDITDYKVMGVEECFDALGWSFDNVTCSCGTKLECSGIVYTDHIVCPTCHKRAIDLFSPLYNSGAALLLDCDKFEDRGKKHWIAIDNNGGITYDRLLGASNP